MIENTTTAADVLLALDEITAGRVIRRAEDAFAKPTPWVVTKTSHIPGKAVAETPGLVCGAPSHPVKRLAVSMTITESQIELAGAIGVDAIVAHHPVADAASSGGVPLLGYVGLYGIAIFEVHEAFHGRHPGIGIIHGHRPFRMETTYAGVPGNVMFVGKALPEVTTAGDILDRLASFIDLARERQCLETERLQRDCPELVETTIAVAPVILNGTPESPVGTILHIFPHTGFTPDHLRRARQEHPDIDTVIASISRVKPGSPLVNTARELGLTMLAGTAHSLEILENGMPLAFALQTLLPHVEVLLFRERVTAQPIVTAGSPAIRQYAQDMAAHLLTKK